MLKGLSVTIGWLSALVSLLCMQAYIRVSNVKMQSQHFLVMTVHNCCYIKDKD